MLRCKHIEFYLTTGWDERFSEKELELIITHLECCPNCLRLSKDLEDIWQLLDHQIDLEPSPAFKENFWRKVELLEKRSQDGKGPKGLFALSWRFIAATTALVAIWSSIYFLYQGHRPPTSTPVQFTQVDKLDDQFLKELDQILETEPEELSVYGDWSAQKPMHKNGNQTPETMRERWENSGKD